MVVVFDCVGFVVIDVYMSDIFVGWVDLDVFKGLVVCGGFFYGDVFGVGEGWVKLIFFNVCVCDGFQVFFVCKDSFVFGVCNGCQMMFNLYELIFGIEFWLYFVCNCFEQFEVWVVMVQVQELLLIFLQGMVGLCLLIVIVYGEGYVEFELEEVLFEVDFFGCVLLCFVDNYGKVIEVYLVNFNGLLCGIIGLSSCDGWVIIMMLYFEWVFCVVQNFWCLDDWQEDGGWLCMFCNVWVWVD